MMPKRFRKKPVVIDALQLVAADWGGPRGNITHEPLFGEVLPPAWFIRAVADRKIEIIYPRGSDFVELDIHTPGGTVRAEPGEWIIKGVAGELYPCPPDIFEATYDAVVVEERPDPDRSTCFRCGAATELIPPDDPPVPGPPDPPTFRHVDDKTYATSGGRFGPGCKRRKP